MPSEDAASATSGSLLFVNGCGYVPLQVLRMARPLRRSCGGGEVRPLHPRWALSALHPARHHGLKGGWGNQTAQRIRDL